jgi:NADH-quinone oxidoreductase subunit K
MLELTLLHYIILGALLFTIGVFGLIFNNKSVVGVLISVEIMLLAANINFIAFASFLENIMGQIFAIFVLGVAAAEIGIGLAIMVIYFRNKGDIKLAEINTIKDFI